MHVIKEKNCSTAQKTYFNIIQP